MQLNIPLIALTLFFGIGTGYWLGGGCHWQTQPPAPRRNAAPANAERASDNALVRSNHRLLKRLDRRLNDLDTAGGGCEPPAGLVSDIRSAVRQTLENSTVNSAKSVPSSGNGTRPSEVQPSRKQQERFETVKQRIYSYASSGRPLIKALGADSDFQKLTEGQKKRIMTEVANRFNRGEITMDQLRGRQ